MQTHRRHANAPHAVHPAQTHASLHAYILAHALVECNAFMYVCIYAQYEEGNH